MPKHSAKSLKKSTLLLAAHGSSKPDGGSPIHVHAEAIRASGLFGAVVEGYLKQDPLLDTVLPEITTDRLFIVPMLTGHGYITDELIPGALSVLSDTVNIRLCEPIGCHSAAPALLARLINSIITGNDLNRRTVSVLLAAHGNSKNKQSAEQVKSLASAVAEESNGVTVNAAFIEEAPLISDWHIDTTTGNLIVLPFLIGGGLHGAEDVPNMIGLAQDDPAIRALGPDTPVAGPLQAHGRRIWYCRTFGQEPELTEMIIDLVKVAQ